MRFTFRPPPPRPPPPVLPPHPPHEPAGRVGTGSGTGPAAVVAGTLTSVPLLGAGLMGSGLIGSGLIGSGLGAVPLVTVELVGPGVPVLPVVEPFEADDPSPLVYTFSALTVQYASLNAVGLFCTYSSQVGARPEHVESEAQVSPAQTPQKVVSKTICWSLKKVSMSQDEEDGKLAIGVPQPDGSGASPRVSDGAPPPDQAQMLMPSLVHSRA